MARRLKPTARAARERHYRRPGGPWDVPSLDAVLTEAAPRLDLLVAGPVRLDSATVNETVAGLAGGLRARGVRRGDAVVWQAPNRIEAVLLLRACWRLGAVAVPFHHRARSGELTHMLGQVRPKALLSAPGLPLADHDGVVEIPSGSSEHGAGGGGEWGALLAGDPVIEGAARPGDLACVLFTAGSTGGPKGVLHTHRGLASKALAMRGIHGLTSDDAVLMPAPLAHISGILNGVLVPGVVPMKTVLMEQWRAEDALDLVASERITFMIGPPTFFVQMMEAPGFGADTVASLRLVSSGGAGVTPSFVEKASAALGAVVKRTYGSTEAPTVTTSYAGDDPVRARETDGRATGDVELRVTDVETGQEMPRGERGELWLRGPELFAGYVDRGQTRAAVAEGGWFRTGDLATLSPDGWLTIVGRLKDVIIRGGENISASEVEGVLEAHPAVRHAVVLGYADETLGERVAAFVVTGEAFDLETCRAWFEERGVAKYKTPEYVVALDEIPVLAAGKPDRLALRARLDAALRSRP